MRASVMNEKIEVAGMSGSLRGRMPFQWIGVLLLLVLPSLGTTVHAQEGPTIVVGGPGGGEDIDKCDYNYALVALVAVKEKDVNSLSGVCRQILDGRAVGPKVSMGTWGDPNVDYRKSKTSATECPDEMVVESITVQISGVNLVHSVAVLCKHLATGARGNGHYVGSGGGVAYEAPAGCGGGAYASGVIIHSGSMVDGVGLWCRVAVATPAPKAPTDKPIRGAGKPKVPTPPSDAPLKVDNGDGGNGGGGNGGGATAATDTTIYDEPGGSDVDYLSAGDPVAIVSCNGDNWCRISTPRKGWVWGDDLSR